MSKVKDLINKIFISEQQEKQGKTAGDNKKFLAFYNFFKDGEIDTVGKASMVEIPYSAFSKNLVSIMDAIGGDELKALKEAPEDQPADPAAPPRPRCSPP